MNTYIAFLRGVNISGKNRLSMPELKTELENSGYSAVSTYLNSGNIAFGCEDEDIRAIRRDLENLICDRFGLDIPVYIIEKARLHAIFEHAPGWWNSGNKEKYDNLIFILTEDAPDAIRSLIGPVSEELEQTGIYENVIFWTFDRKLYQKCRWWKRTAAPGIAQKLTIRTAGTVQKMLR